MHRAVGICAIASTAGLTTGAPALSTTFDLWARPQLGIVGREPRKSLMTEQYVFEEYPGYALVKVAGSWRRDLLLKYIDRIAIDCRFHGCDRVLVDALEVGGQLTDIDRFVAGERVAEVCKGIRMAAILPAHQINKFGEFVATSRGAELLVTSDRDQALKWLLTGADHHAALESPGKPEGAHDNRDQ